jgi:NAD(P)-dependent dehydrogenase (short-subunit alcohol dehydrogenase family)
MAGIVEGKVALVTGAGAGIGRGIAELLAHEGAAVVVANRNATAGQETVERIVMAGGRAIFAATDVRREEDCRGAVQQAIDAYGRLDCLVNNAGIFPRSTLEETTATFWDEIMDTNLKGPFFLCKYAMRASLPARTGYLAAPSAA